MMQATDQHGRWVSCEHCYGSGSIRVHPWGGVTFICATCKACGGSGGHFVPDETI